MFTGYRNIPTVDIYFRAPLADLIVEWGITTARRPIRRIGPYTFISGDRAVVLRYITPKERSILERRRPRSIYYLLDDDLFSLAADTSLPTDYRDRLQAFASRQLPWITAHASQIIAPSQSILARFPEHSCTLLDPAYTAVCPDFSHFESECVDIVFPGTRSHLSDIEPLAAGLRHLIERHRQLTLTTYLGEHAPAALAGHARIRNRPAEKWPRYRTTLETSRYHLALAPHQETVFNNARSINKILDVAAVGAAGLYSARPPSSGVVTHGVDGLLLGDDPDDWLHAIDRLVCDRTALRRLAEGAKRLALHRGDPNRVRSFWRERMLPPR